MYSHRFLYLGLMVVFMSCAHRKKDITDVLKEQLAKGYDTINLKNKFHFKWDRMVLAAHKEDVAGYLDEGCGFLNERNDIEGMPAEKLSMIFICNRKIVYHEDTRLEYSGFDQISGGFNFMFEESVNGKTFKSMTADSALFRIKKVNAGKREQFLLTPFK